MCAQHFIEEGSKTAGKALNENKKQILLIGDSIRIGYCQKTKEELSSIADVYFPDENCRNSQHIICSMRLWLNVCDPDKIDVVQFNCGHWDVAHWGEFKYRLTSKREFKKNIQNILLLIRLLFKNAKIVFATTTPMNPKPVPIISPRTTKEIKMYNDIAVKVCKKQGVLINDLFAFSKDWDESAYIDYCHFTPEKFNALGVETARYLKTII
jgi:acyl-CoA thioesterase-1